MYFKLILLSLLLAVCAGDSNAKLNGGRQKRLLFYDEEGNLVKTYNNAINNAEKIPYLGSIFSMFHPQNLGLPMLYMIPVSDQVIQQINRDPIYQNKLLTVPRKDLVIGFNALCDGKRTQLPSKSCKNFLNCWDGWAFEQECPEGLLFAKEGYCDYPHNVDCSSRTNEATPAPVTSQCSKEFEAFRSKQLCNEFFICVDRVPVRFKCPADLVYNQELGVCDYAYRVNCGDSTISKDEASEPKPSAMCSPSPPAPATPTATADASILATPGLLQPGSEGLPSITDAKTIVTTNSEFNSQTWSSSHVAISRQDAIRQLQHGATNI